MRRSRRRSAEEDFQRSAHVCGAFRSLLWMHGSLRKARGACPLTTAPTDLHNEVFDKLLILLPILRDSCELIEGLVVHLS